MLTKPTGRQLIETERARQIQVKGFTRQWDDTHCLGDELSRAARCYAAAGPATPPPADWPWPAASWNPRDEQSNWVRAGALYLASAEQAWRRGRPATRARARRRAVALTVRLDLARGRWGEVGSCDR